VFVYNGYYGAWANATGVQGEQGSAFLFSHLDLFVVPIALLVGGRLMYFVVSMWVAGWGRTCGETAEGGRVYCAQ